MPRRRFILPAVPRLLAIRRNPTLPFAVSLISVQRLLLAAALGLGFIGAHGSAAPIAGAKVDFNRDIRPILSENCFACHGPDKDKRKAGLRLDLKDDAF